MVFLGLKTNIPVFLSPINLYKAVWAFPYLMERLTFFSENQVKFTNVEGYLLSNIIRTFT